MKGGQIDHHQKNLPSKSPVLLGLKKSQLVINRTASALDLAIETLQCFFIREM